MDTNQTHTYNSEIINSENNDKADNDNFPLTAWVFTVIWLIIIIMLPIFILFHNYDTFSFKGLELNEVGDYLAGVAAPLAFFWLVFGYYQQGRELKVNNKMLKLQYKELSNSVIAQNLQAESMKEQAQSLHKQVQLVIRDKYYPKFLLKTFQYLKDDLYIDIELENTGNTIFSVDVEVLSDNMILLNGGVDHNGKNISFSIQTTEDIENKFNILFNISFVLETGDSAKLCYKIPYTSFMHSPSLNPDLEITNCKENT